MVNSIGIIILAGGSSRRMGEDKGLITVKGKSIIQYLIDTCEVVSNDILIVSNTNDYDQFGYPVVSDIIPNIGPLGGLHSGLINAKQDFNIVLSCDVPLVSVALLKSLIDCKDQSKLAVIAKHEKQVHPLVGMYSKNCLDIINVLVGQNRFRMSGLYQHAEMTIIDLSHFPAKEFLNLNTAKELALFKKHLNDG